MAHVRRTLLGHFHSLLFPRLRALFMGRGQVTTKRSLDQIAKSASTSYQGKAWVNAFFSLSLSSSFSYISAPSSIEIKSEPLRLQSKDRGSESKFDVYQTQRKGTAFLFVLALKLQRMLTPPMSIPSTEDSPRHPRRTFEIFCTRNS